MTAMDAYQQATLAILLFYVENILLSGDKSIILPPLRASLDSKYNTIECASELRSYYKSRPEMRSYTLETELPRADYVVLVNDAEGKTQELTTTQEIQEYFASKGDKNDLDETEDIILRASNQSLLADILAALTGSDKLIRMQHFVTGVAAKCQFSIDLRKDECNNRGVTVTSTLLVSMPSGDFERSDARLNLANIHVRAQFHPSSAPEDHDQVRYEILSLEPLLSLSSDAHLLVKASKSLAKDLKELERINADVPEEKTQEEEDSARRDSHFKQVVLHSDNHTISHTIDASKKGICCALKKANMLQRAMLDAATQTKARYQHAKEEKVMLKQAMLDAAIETKARYQNVREETNILTQVMFGVAIETKAKYQHVSLW